MEKDTNIEHVLQTQNSKIINSLNPDCWRLILDYLSVKELLQTEATCKDWQELILNHISHRPIVVNEDDDEENHIILRKTPNAWSSFKQWTAKCGRSVHEFSMNCHCFKDVVEVLRADCPNLTTLSLSRLKKKLSPTSTLHFKKLLFISFDDCDEVTDECVSQFLHSDIRSLTITHNKRVTGRFLNNLKSDNLGRLVIRHCRAFKYPFLLSARLSNVTEIVFWKRNRSKIEIRDKLHMLIDKMPKLREICLKVHDMHKQAPEDVSGEGDEHLAVSDAFFESVCRLTCLRSLRANFQVWDHHLEALANACKGLAAVMLFTNNVTKRGLDALCRSVGASLYQLDLSESQVTDEDLVACLYACPNLMFLDIRDCPLLERAIYRIAVARRDMRDTVPSVQRLHALGFRLVLTISPWDFYEPDLVNYEDILNIRYPEEQISISEHEY